MDFSTYSEDSQQMLVSAYNVITRMEKWNYIKETQPGDSGYTFTKNEELINIMNEINDDYQYHSAASLGWTMRIMQQIALENQEINPSQ
tara:strand:+ start:1036 stop:1302 length:267 start_codon:yes stop_codon:yes gene_type:complete